MPDFQTVLESPVRTFEEGLRFFRGTGMLNETLRKLARDLDERGIPYNVVGAVALNQHGYHRFTEDIDILLSPDGLARFRSTLVGKGYRPAFPGATTRFRETENNVPVEIVISGGFPGDGKPKPVQFHDPETGFVVMDGVKTVEMPRLVEMKLASGMTSPGRLRDLADVQELIRHLSLDQSFADQLNPYVRDKYLELWESLSGESD